MSRHIEQQIWPGQTFAILAWFQENAPEILQRTAHVLSCKDFLRMRLCGDISTYNVDTPPRPLHNIRYLMGKRARMEGFNTLDHWDRYHEAAAQLAAWKEAGDLKFREHVLDGLDRAPEAFVRLFAGDHLGKLVVKVAP